MVATLDFFDQIAGRQVLVPYRDEVESYISHHAGIGELVPSIAANLRDEFGPEVELSLELFKDVESGDRYLTLYVRQNDYCPDIIKRIDAVTDRFDASLEKLSGYLLITSDFRKPRGANGV